MEKTHPVVDIFLDQLFYCRDTENLILKGHILTEYALNFYIGKKAIQDVDFEQRFTYANKLDIAKILGLFKENQVLENELKLLNKLRNSLAHNLKYNEKILRDFLNGFEYHRKRYKSKRIENLKIDDEIKYEINFEKVSVKGSHLLLMFNISIICVTVFEAYDPTLSMDFDNLL